MKHFPAPHITIYLDATPEQCFSRIQKRGRVSTFVEVYIYIYMYMYNYILVYCITRSASISTTTYGSVHVQHIQI